MKSKQSRHRLPAKESTEMLLGREQEILAKEIFAEKVWKVGRLKEKLNASRIIP